MASAIDLDEFLNCEICFEVIDNPQSLTCRHVFCGKCVDRIKHGNKIECPVCKIQSNVCDIKPDYRTVSMVDSYRTNLTRDPSTTEASKCETCEDKSVKVSHKCETCDLLLCDKCEASHTSSGSVGGSHTTKAIAALAGDTRTEINKALKDLNTQEQILASKLSNRHNELDKIRKTSDNALESIAEKEENLHAKIKRRHDNLRKELEKEKTKHIKMGKKEYKSIEGCYNDVKDKQAMLKCWVNDRSELSIVNTTEQIHKKLQDIEKESAKNQQDSTSVENFTVKVLEGNECDPNGCTKLIFSTNKPTDGKESEESVRGSDKSQVREASVSGSTQSLYTTAVCREYTAEKTVDYFYEEDYNPIDSIQRYNNHLYCMVGNRMRIYTKNLAIRKTIALHNHRYPECSAFACVDQKCLITVCGSRKRGLRILNTDGKREQRICPGAFKGVAVHNHKLYAYEANFNKVLIFKQIRDYFWKQSGEFYLNYNGDNKHEEHQIRSFHMANEQIYIAYDTSIYHLDLNGNLKRKISHGEDNREFVSPTICSMDSKGNILVAELQSKRLTVVREDGKCYELMLRGKNLSDISFAFMGDDEECLWVAHWDYEQDTYNHYLTKYRTTGILSAIT